MNIECNYCNEDIKDSHAIFLGQPFYVWVSVILGTPSMVLGTPW